ncbi:TonB-dependent receptor [Dyella sp. 20L07]|uniref:TonB-dependent receptor n=1 Tax=Dyella sp. 20L07 TaxID=3384240 RepID=UPI003D2C2193
MHHASHALRHTLLAASLLAAFAIAPGNAHAQDAATSNTDTAAATKKANPAETTTLGAVTVTAQKRSEDARQVPSSISVVSSEQLDNQHVNSLADLTGSLPGVQITSAGTPGQTNIALRGITSLGAGAVVGTYLDDSPLGSSGNFARSASYALDLLPYDIERVEVLRGPQGTLYGASTMGGLLKYVSKEPDLENVSGRIGGGISSISGGDGTGWDGRASVNLPVIKDQLGIVASVSQNKTPGYIDNVLTGQDGINKVTQRSARLGVLWKPNEDVSLKLTALHQSINADDRATIQLDPDTQQPLYGDQKTGKPIAEPFSKRVNFYAATLNWHLPWADFVSATSYSNSVTHYVEDDSVTFGPLFPLFGNYPAGLSAFDLDMRLKKFTQEFRLSGPQGGNIEWLLGAFYTRETSTNQQVQTAQQTDGAPIIGIDPVFAGGIPSTYKEGALFGNLTYKFNDQFDITGGLRYARNEQDFKQVITGGGGLLVPLGTSPGHSAENVLTWMLSPRYHLSSDSMLYLRAASGYRPGGPNFALPGVPPTVKSDSLVNYEAGWKTLFLDQRASIDLAAYDIHWHGIQAYTSTPNGGITYLANGGTAESRGVEMSAAFMPVHDLRLGLNAAYTDAKLTEDAPGLHGKNGDRLPGIPRVNWALTADYYFRLPAAWSGHVGGSYRWIGDRMSAVSSSPYTYREASYNVLDLNADISKDIWTLRFYVKNLTNKHNNLNISYMQDGITNQVTNLQSAILQPRTIGVEFDTQF